MTEETTVDFERLSSWLPRIEAEIARSYATEKRSVVNPVITRALDTLAEFTLRGGKRLRALLVLAGFHLASRKLPTAALPAAAAIEHFQSWMLIHDDLIDHAEERRGGPTVHRTLADQHGTEQLLGLGDDYGTGMAITLGDLQEPFTVGEFLRCRVPPGRALRAFAEYVRVTRETAYGQLLDIRNGCLPLDRVREADVLEVHEKKTALYTVAGPLRIGAILGGARDRLLADLARAGVDLGVAFQLRDDVLGAGLGNAGIGKSPNDLIEGKRTLLVVKAWSGSNAVGRALLGEVLGNPSAPPERLRVAQELLRSTGSLAYSERRIDELTRRAFGIIDGSPAISSPGKALLHEVGERLVHRSV